MSRDARESVLDSPVPDMRLSDYLTRQARASFIELFLFVRRELLGFDAGGHAISV
jgi:hypothetical protein